MSLNTRGSLGAVLGGILSLGLAAGDCEGVDTPPPTPFPTPTPAPATPTATPCQDGFGLCDRQPNTTCLFESFAEAPPEVEVERAFPSLSFSLPVFLTHAPGDDDQVFVVEKGGRVRAFDNDQAASETRLFLDISDRVAASSNEMGLLGVAFHPSYPSNGYVFVDYTASSPRRTVISRFRRDSADPSRIDPSTELVLLEVSQPYGNHNGGMVAFGPDGYLYVGLGDGGSAGDPNGAGQDPSRLLATLLRLDVDNPLPGLNYGYPDDNPFVDGGGRPEVWAWGLRNPWRFSFDSVLGTLWVGDVGQDKWEEIDVITGGGNYGWNTLEGTHCYSPAEGCDPAGKIPPVIEYSHSVGRSVTGGYVYRGAALPELYGRYLYGDYVTGIIWAATWDGAQITSNIQLADTTLAISSFGEGPDGEVYALSYGGTVNRFRRAGEGGSQGVFPTRLSETGCFSDVAGRSPAPGVIPYEVNSPLWSDGDLKDRWLALPGTQTLGFTEEGAWQLPDGTSLWKDFYVYEDARHPSTRRLLETRLLLKLGGEWRGYTYRWDEDQTDAYLLDDALTEVLSLVDEGGQRYSKEHYYPSRTDCQSCHTAAAGFTLGLRTGQMNRDHSYRGQVDNQLRAFDHVGLFSAPLEEEPSAYLAFPAPSDASAPTELRARSYLEANCAHCHLPGGPGVSTIDLRYGVAFGDTGTCDAEPGQGDLGVTGARIIAPGDPARSTLSLRMHTLEGERMPPLASSVVDPQGTAVVDRWITGLTGCP